MATNSADTFIALSPVHVSTQFLVQYTDVGLRGLALKNESDHAGIQTYRSMEQLENDYDIDSPIWTQANAYFAGATDGQVQVISYDKSYIPAAPTNVKTSTTTNSVTVSADGAPTASPLAGFLYALKKYYGAGFEYILVNVTKDTTDFAVAVSNFIEAQNKGYLLLNFPTDAGSAPDFSFFETIKDNRATKPVSLPANLDPNATLGAEAIGKYVEKPIGANFKFLKQFQTVQPQDRYEFTSDDLKPYEKYNVATLAFENGVPETTNGRSLSGISTGIMIEKDNITTKITNKVSDFISNPDNGFVPYDQASINMIIGIIQGVLKEEQNKSLIEDYVVPPYDVSKLTEEQKATGKLTGIGWNYEPMRSVDEAWFSQTLEITEIE